MPQNEISRPQTQHWIKLLDPWMQDFYPVLGWDLAPAEGEQSSSQHPHWIKSVSHLNMPKTSSGGQILGFKMSKSRGREEKLRQKKAERRKKKQLGNMKTPTFLLGLFLANFNYKTGEKLRFLTKRCPPVGVSPKNITSRENSWGIVSRVIASSSRSQLLRLTFPTAKLRRQMFMTRRSLGEELGEILDEISWAFSWFMCCGEPCHGSCGWSLKISSPRASGAWDPPIITQKNSLRIISQQLWQVRVAQHGGVWGSCSHQWRKRVAGD